VHTFGTAHNGEEPSSGVFDDGKGDFFGTTFYGGTTNSTCTLGCGVLYQIAAGGKYSVLHRFTGANDGWLPTGGLIEDASGNLYGAALLGGSGNGVIYKVTP
jgi:uncharacterized repeat protein (TIGR03803 family)